MRAADRQLVIDALAKDWGIENLPEKYDPRFSFWQRRPHSEFRSRSTEPDLVICVTAHLKIILEIKWGAPLSPKELAAQWASFDGETRCESHHVLLSRNVHQYHEAIESDRMQLRVKGISAWTIHKRTWNCLASTLNDMVRDPACPEHIRTWARLSAEFLRCQELSVLNKWDDMGMRNIRPHAWQFRRETISFSRWQLHKVTRLGWPSAQ